MAHKLESAALSRFVIAVLVVGLLITVGALLHILFSEDISNLTIEILAAVVGVVLVIVSVAVTIHFQVSAETEREFKVELFRTKVKNYEEFIRHLVRTDDDEIIGEEELEHIRNLGAQLSLFASSALVSEVSRFVEKVRVERSLALSDDADAGDSGTFRSVIMHMRRDLAVDDSTDPESFKSDVRKIIDKSQQAD